MPLSFSYCVTIVNPSILSQVVLKGRFALKPKEFQVDHKPCHNRSPEKYEGTLL
jgi:hypothetical protein